MFERIKCCRNLIEDRKFLQGCIVFGNLIGNDQMVQEATDTLIQNETIMKKMWFDRETAKKYNTMRIIK